MLTSDERKTLERLSGLFQSMTEMQKAQVCAFTEGMALMASGEHA